MLILLVSGSVCAFSLAGNVQSQPKPVRRVLVFYELGLSSPAVALLDQQIRASLDSPYQIELYREYLETTLFPDPSTQQGFRDWYIHKYRDRKPDLIVALGRTPLRFMVDVHDRAFPDVPIVFGGTDEVLAGYPKLDSHFTGVWERFDAEKTLEAALRLQPTTRHVVVIGGTSDFDLHLEALFKDRLRQYENQLDFKYLTEFDMPTLLGRLQHLPENTVILHTHIGEDAAGTHFIGASQVDPLIARVANAPIFGPSDVDIGHGEVGGDLVSFSSEGKIIGNMALRILNGESPSDIPVVKGANVYMFDWQALHRWHLRENNLPPGSVVLNRQLTVWESFKWYIIFAVSLIVLEALLIGGLLWQRARRRKAENELGITYDRLRMAVEAGRFVGWDWDIKAGTNRWFGNLETIFGIKSDSYFAQPDEFRNRVHPDDRAAVAQAIETAREKRQPYAAEFRVPRENGNVRWVIASGKFYYASNGDPERMLGLAVDITERKLAEEALRSVSRRLIEAQEKERVRIARELHDDINQRLAMLQIDVKAIRGCPTDSRAELQERLEGVSIRLSDTSNEVQAISHRLHSSKLEYLGLVAACKSFCIEVAERQKMNIQFKADSVPPEIPQDVSLTLFRVLQESLQNAIKHSGDQHFEVQLRGTSGELQLTVRDHGQGFNVDAAMTSHGLGLISMRERVSSVRGTILIRSNPMVGTDITVGVPIVATERATQVTSGAA